MGCKNTMQQKGNRVWRRRLGEGRRPGEGVGRAEPGFSGRSRAAEVSLNFSRQQVHLVPQQIHPRDGPPASQCSDLHPPQGGSRASGRRPFHICSWGLYLLRLLIPSGPGHFSAVREDPGNMVLRDLNGGPAAFEASLFTFWGRHWLSGILLAIPLSQDTRTKEAV